MKVDIQAVNFNVDRKLVDFINIRLEKLEQYFDKIVDIDVNLRVPGDDIVVKKTAKSFEEAVDLAGDAAERLLIKRKEKMKSH